LHDSAIDDVEVSIPSALRRLPNKLIIHNALSIAPLKPTQKWIRAGRDNKAHANCDQN
jgi:hypothetical protein